MAILVKVKKKTNGDETQNGKEELTPKYTEAKEKMSKAVESSESDIKQDKIQATPKVFYRKVVKSGGETGTTKILSDDGKTVKYEGRTNMKATQDALSQNQRQSADTNERRASNANNYNVQSGAKKDLTKEDVESLRRLGKIAKK